MPLEMLRSSIALLSGAPSLLNRQNHFAPDRSETKGAREQLSRHLMELYIGGEKDQHHRYDVKCRTMKIAMMLQIDEG
jgi:hypothetical protein